MVEWKVHTPNLLQEILLNKGAEALRQPLNIFGLLLHQVAERASELNDAKMNLLMLRLTLYDVADPEKHTFTEIKKVWEEQSRRLEA